MQQVLRLRTGLGRLYTYRSFSALAQPIEANENVLLRATDDPRKSPFFTPCLEAHGTIRLRSGRVNTDEILGKPSGATLHTSRGNELRIERPSLDQYITLSPRLVTPIYPVDASLIVNLLDIHAPHASATSALTPPLEILEAGTGHGSLTLHLLRAIYGFNDSLPESSTPVPFTLDLPTTSKLVRAALRNLVSTSSTDALDSSITASSPPSPALEDWKRRRRAVIHTIDASVAHGAYAERIVNSFRRRLYAGGADFYAGIDVRAWVDAQLESSSRQGEPFLTAAILDLPGVAERISSVARAVREGGAMVAFAPSVTQILECERRVRSEGAGLVMEGVWETGGMVGVGGREWSVALVRPRAAKKKALEEQAGGSVQDSDAASEITEQEEGVTVSDDAEGSEAEKAASHDTNTHPSTVMENGTNDLVSICRPKPFTRVIGGGFIGMWRKTSNPIHLENPY